MSKIKCTAIKCEQNGTIFYVAVMNSTDLKEMCFVSRKDENPVKGFQRLLSPTRAKKIEEYMNKNGVIPSAVILSAQPSAQLSYSADSNEMWMEKIPETLLVLDGQHRLFGFFGATKNYEVPVVIFDGLNTQEEVRQFIDINTTQRGVPTALILDIKGQAGIETKIEERQSTLLDKINSDSVLAGYLSRNKSVKGKVSRVAFNQATEEIFKNSFFSTFNDEQIYRVLKNYLGAVDTVFKASGSKDARLTKNTIFKTVMGLFIDTCFKCYSKAGDFKQETFVEYLMPLAAIDYSMFTGTNKATEKSLLDAMENALIGAVDPNNEGLY